MKLEDFNFDMEEKKTCFDINGKTIEVKHYLPIESKVSLVQIAIQQSIIGSGFINPILLDAYFNLYVVFYYSNIEFTDEEKQNALATYDILALNDVILKVEAGIPKEEFEDLFNLCTEYSAKYEKYINSTSSIINTIIESFPKRMEEVQKIIENFDPSKYQAVVDFATAANGGRNINTNK